MEAINAEALKTLKVDLEKVKELREKIKTTQAHGQTKIDNILTKEQQEKFKTIQNERQAERQAKMKELAKNACKTAIKQTKRNNIYK